MAKIDLTSKHDGMNCPQPDGGKHGDYALGDHWHVDHDPVPTSHT